FPGRTETDMYLWVSDHKYLLQKRLGWHIRSDVAATHLAEEMSTRWVSEVRRLWRRVIGRLVPQQLADVPAPGAWIQAQDLESSCLFKDLLVPVSGEEDGWLALEQALVMARCQGTYLNGLHVIPTGADPQDPTLAGVKSRFEERCREAGKTGALAVVPGEISRQVLEQVILNDLVVLHIAHPPGTQLSARLGSGLRTIIRACPRPILAVGGSKSPVDSLLLAYDGSIKGREALFLAAYFAGRWKTRLTVLTAHELGKTSRGTLDQARRYLEKRGIQAKYIYKSGPAPAAILAAAGEAASNLLVMGGYGFSPMMEMVLGSSVDQVLRESSIPVMICQ
ncbi:MAG TPA: universal stress protein, partial [Anaerolineaceae bacterium]